MKHVLLVGSSALSVPLRSPVSPSDIVLAKKCHHSGREYKERLDIDKLTE